MNTIPRFLMQPNASRLISSVNHRTGIVTHHYRNRIIFRSVFGLVVLGAVAAVLGRVL